MRPLHSLLFLVLLGALGLGAWLLLSFGDDQLGGPAAPLPDAQVAVREREAPPADLTEPRAEPESAPEARTVLEPEPVPETEVAATPAAERAIRGRLVDELGNPLPGMRVVIAPRTGFAAAGADLAGADELPWIRRAETETDDAGVFEVDVEEAPGIVLAARGAGFAPLDASFDVPRGRAHDLGDLELERGVVLGGRVLDPSGAGVPDAELRALPLDAEGFVFQGPGGQRGRFLARTGADGAFRVDQLASGPYRILVRAETFPELTKEGTTERPGQQVHGLEWRLESGRSIEGTLVGAPAERLAALWVRAVPVRGGDAEPLVLGGFEQRTASVADDGRFRIDGLREGVEYRVSAREGERRFWSPVRSESVTVAAGTRGVQLEWRLEAALVFRVVDAETGEPVERFGVRAGVDWPVPLTDEEGNAIEVHPGGRVRFGGLQVDGGGGRARLEIEAVGYRALERRDIEVRPGEELELGTLRLSRVPLVHVRVLDAATGEPVRRARVTLREQRDPSGDVLGDIELQISEVEAFLPGRTRSTSGRTDEEGRVTLSSIPDAVCELVTNHRAFAESSLRDVHLSTTGDTELEVRLLEGGTVVVTVVDSQGLPVADAAVAHRAPNERGTPFSFGGRGQRTDAEGRMTFEHLLPGAHAFRLSDGNAGGVFLADASGGMSVAFAGGGGEPADPAAEEWSSVEVVDRETAELTLTAPARCVLFGSVLEAGKPLAGAKVRLREDGDMGFETDFLGFSGAPSARTDGDGEFRLEDVEIGEYDLVVTHPERAMPTEFRVELVEGENDAGRLDLVVCIVEGRITNADGDPLGGVRVEPRRLNEGGGQTRITMSSTIVVGGGDSGSEMSISSGGEDRSVTTDADGRYRLRGLEADRELVLSATRDGLQPARSEPLVLDPDEVRTGVDLVLREGGALTVVGTKPDGTAPGFCLVEATHVESDGEEELADPRHGSLSDGRTTLTGLAPGTWSVTLTPLSMDPTNPAPPQETEPHLVRVVAGETAEVAIPVP